MFDIKQFEYELILGGIRVKQAKNCVEAAAQRRHTGLVCKLLHQHFRRRFEENARKSGLDDVTINHGRILGFLARNAGTAIFQKDIEKAFQCNRSTVTTIVGVMEKNGLIERHSVPQDNRLKQVLLTEKGEQMHRKSIAIIEQTERQMLEGIPEEELCAFFATVRKMEENLMREDAVC